MRNRLSKNIVTLIALGAYLFGSTSCQSWFDVNPKVDLKADKLFDTEHGYVSALAGLYISMTHEHLYGKEMSYGIMDQLAQYYDKKPQGASDDFRRRVYSYTQGESFYSAKEKIGNIWEKSYNIIANANNLLVWLEKKGNQVITTQRTRDMIRGEALALRAYLHFDLLRAWGPIYKNAPEALSIPYRQELNADSKQPLLPANQVLDLIIADLIQARDLLSFEQDKPLRQASGIETLEKRQFRMNYHAVNALLARVYCYKGDADLAVEAAQRVIDYCGLDLQGDNGDDPIQYREALFALNRYKMDDFVKSDFSLDTDRMDERLYTSIESFKKIYEVESASTEDIRAQNKGGVEWFPALEKVMSRKYLKNEAKCIPLIRLPEMYYILCEMSSLEEANEYINKVRNRRGFSSSLSLTFSSDSDRITALDKEYRKEFYAEGQYFYFLKRQAALTFVNAPMDNFGPRQYIFPRPDSEIEYGYTPKDDDDENEDDEE